MAAGAMLGTPACASQRKPVEKPVVIATPAEPGDGAPKPAPPEEPPTAEVPPAPVTPAPAMITLTIETNPPGSELYLDGKMVGTSPAKIEIAAGSADMVLRVVREGYADELRGFKAEADQNMMVEMKAVRARGTGSHKTGRGFILS